MYNWKQRSVVSKNYDAISGERFILNWDIERFYMCHMFVRSVDHDGSTKDEFN
jgi:hypothetical protein